MVRPLNIFLSHGTAETEFARALADKLSKAGFSVWRESEVLPGDNWGEKVGQALERADAMVVLISPSALESPWFTREIEYALGNERFEGRFIPVMVKPTPARRIPWILQHLNLMEVRDPGKAGREVAKMLTAAEQSNGR